MEHLILVRFGEIFLKGLNRPFFLNRLVRQIRRVIVPYGGQAILSDSRVMVTGYQDEAACIQRISKVFGVHSLCPAIAMDKGDFEAIAQQAISMMEGSTGTFKVDARRSHHEDGTVPRRRRLRRAQRRAHHLLRHCRGGPVRHRP